MRNLLALALSICLLLVAGIAGHAFAAEMYAAPPGEALPPPASWQSIVTMVISMVVVPFVVRFLKAKATESDKASEGHVVNMNQSLIEQKGLLIERLKAYLFRRAGDLVESEFPRLASAVVNGQMKTAADVKSWLYAIGKQLRGEAVSYFAEQGVDIVATFGQKAIDDLIESAANKVSPFPGMETAVAILKDGVAPILLQRGIQYVRDNAPYLAPPITVTGTTVAPCPPDTRIGGTLQGGAVAQAIATPSAG